MIRALLLACLLTLAACSGASDDPEAEFAKDLATATQQARAKLPLFWEHFEAPEVDEYDFSLKAAIPRRDGHAGVEEAWLENIARSDSVIVGELSVNPRYLGELRAGAIIEFQPSQITDWAFMRGNNLLGHYTTRVLLPRLDSQQAEWLRPLLSGTPDGT
ncbi:MAG: DUF2314 domain-containing protein [Alphaproteobacteria bacterium]|nr:MAG: DUF2314 domain-containing protein [Alphaproteobacteria bacterium]